jgi:hypothetical protein
MNARLLTVLAAWCVIAHMLPDSHAQARRLIEVRSVVELYAAVENDANRDATLSLSAGTYHISRPLRLLSGMELVGVNRYQDVDRDGVWDRLQGGSWVVDAETVLDAQAMTAEMPIVRDCNADGVSTDNPEPAIVAGHGSRVRGVTIKPPPDGTGIGAAGDLSGDVAVTIEDIVIEGGRRGAVLVNRGCASRRSRLTLALDRTIITGSRVGLTLANFSTDREGIIEGPAIIATIRRNLLTGNETGSEITGGMQGTDGATVEITSAGNRFEHNTAGGMLIRAGASQRTSPGASANGNAVRFSSTNDFFESNGPSAITLIASDRQDTAGENHGNSLIAHITDADIRGASPGVVAIGGRDRGTDANAKSGTGNVVTLSVRAANRPPVSTQTDNDRPARSFPIVPANRVELIP